MTTLSSKYFLCKTNFLWNKFIMRNIGARIRALRAEQSLSLPKLAEKSELSQGLLSKMENSEEPNPSLETLQKLARALKTTIADIIGADVVVSARE